MRCGSTPGRLSAAPCVPLTRAAGSTPARPEVRGAGRAPPPPAPRVSSSVGAEERVRPAEWLVQASGARGSPGVFGRLSSEPVVPFAAGGVAVASRERPGLTSWPSLLRKSPAGRLLGRAGLSGAEGPVGCEEGRPSVRPLSWALRDVTERVCLSSRYLWRPRHEQRGRRSTSLR